MMEGYEKFERELDPHRAEEQRRAREEAVDRLRRLGIRIDAGDDLDGLADLSDAVERFEVEVEGHGGDLMVDDLKSTAPDDRHFVLPARLPGEALSSYVGRIDGATARLGRHPRRPD
jgi:hypothetical protein